MREGEVREMREHDIDEFTDSRLVICNLCKKELETDSEYCIRCPVHRLARIAFDYNNNICKKNVRPEDTYVTLSSLDGMVPYKDEWKYEHYDLYKKAGVFAIFIDDRLSYISKSRNILVNWLFITQTITNDIHEGKAKVYQELIREHYSGSKIGFGVLEFCYDVDNLDEELDDMKDKWIKYYKPRLNYIK